MQFHKISVTESQDPEPQLVQCTLHIHSSFVYDLFKGSYLRHKIVFFLQTSNQNC
jgi:hypothetical protein